MSSFSSLDDLIKAGNKALHHPAGDEKLPLWEWLPATIPSRQPTFAERYGGHEMPLPQE